MQQALKGLTVIIMTYCFLNFHSAVGWGKTAFDTVHINDGACGPRAATQ